MRKHVKFLGLIGFIVSVSLISIHQVWSNIGQNVQVMRNLTSMPLAFTENQGQWDEKVLFRANAGGATMWFTKDGATYQFTRYIRGEKGKGAPPLAVGSERLNNESDSFETELIKVTLVGGNPAPQVRGMDMMEYKCNYFFGNDPAGWQTDVATYEAIVYEEVYPGIDLKYYGNGKQMEYDFVVAPGADYSQIRLHYEGAKSISINNSGELEVATGLGTVTELVPVVYQLVQGKRHLIPTEYKILSDNSVQFRLSESPDPGLALVIDPVLLYGTYLGGDFLDGVYGIAVDASGYAYVTGFTASTDFPTENPYQGTLPGGSSAFVTKFSAAGNTLIYSTFLGGTDSGEESYGIVVDASGNAYITGLTGSTDFPTVNPYQTDQVYQDGFVTKISSAGNSLIYSTYLGGNNNDGSQGIAIDASGNAYVTGYTESNDFPTENPYQSSMYGREAFVTKLNSTGDALVYSTYLGGNGNEGGSDIDVDVSGNAYVIGWTTSTDFPTENPFQTNQPASDGFVTKLNSTGDALVYSTYLGGTNGAGCTGIAVDATGNAYVTGSTTSTDFPTENPYQTHQTDIDAFVTKFSSTGDALVYSTYLGGNANDEGQDIAVDTAGNAYVIGTTSSTDFPTVDPYQTDQPTTDAFVTKFDNTGTSLIYSTYLGGTFGAHGYGIAIDASGNAYVTGVTSSEDFPTENPYQADPSGFGDIFVAKLGPEVDQNIFVVTNTDEYGDGSLNWTIQNANTSPGQDTILFDISGRLKPLTDLDDLADAAGTVIWGSSAPDGAGSFIIDFGNGIMPFDLNVSNNVIEGLKFVNGLSGAIVINTDSNLIINNTFDSCLRSILIASGNFNTIGGYESDKWNVIETAYRSGIEIDLSDSNLVLGNTITGELLGYGSGIMINSGIGNFIDSNKITSFDSTGIVVDGASQCNTFTRNQIYNNGKLGIDLANDSVTNNDTDDLDGGPNDLLNFPEIDSIKTPLLNLDYYVWGHAAPNATVEFFVAQYFDGAIHLDDPTGYGEAYEYAGSCTCDGSGLFEYRLWDSFSPFTKFTATATDVLGNTSEFCENFVLMPRPLIISGYTIPLPILNKDCPSAINLRVIDPDGNRIGYDADEVFYDEIADASYTETVECNDSVYITDPLLGSYIVEVVAETGTVSRTTYGVGIRLDGSDETMLVVDRGTPPADSTESYNYEVEIGWHYMNGDANRDSIINIFDITHIISYLYMGGEEPWPLHCGDANCDLVTNIFDITHLITYLYLGGAEPCYLEE